MTEIEEMYGIKPNSQRSIYYYKQPRPENLSETDSILWDSYSPCDYIFKENLRVIATTILPEEEKKKEEKKVEQKNEEEKKVDQKKEEEQEVFEPRNYSLIRQQFHSN